MTVREELELQVRKNELHTTEDIEKALTDVLVNFRTKLMAIPAKLSPIMAKKKDLPTRNWVMLI